MIIMWYWLFFSRHSQMKFCCKFFFVFVLFLWHLMQAQRGRERTEVGAKADHTSEARVWKECPWMFWQWRESLRKWFQYQTQILHIWVQCHRHCIVIWIIWNTISNDSNVIFEVSRFPFDFGRCEARFDLPSPGLIHLHVSRSSRHCRRSPLSFPSRRKRTANDVCLLKVQWFDHWEITIFWQPHMMFLTPGFGPLWNVAGDLSHSSRSQQKFQTQIPPLHWVVLCRSRRQLKHSGFQALLHSPMAQISLFLGHLQSCL